MALPALAVVWWLSAAWAQTPTVATRPVETAAGRAAAEAKLYHALVTKLASPEMEGRGPGTKGADRARDMIVARMQAAGLRPAFSRSYVQQLTAPAGAKIERQELSIAGSGEAAPPDALRAGEEFGAMGLSASASFKGEAVFVGYSVVDARRKYDSYGGAAARDALKGKVAVVLRYEPQDANGMSLWTRRPNSWGRSASLSSKVAHAARRGAAAVLIVNPPRHDAGRIDSVRRTGFSRPGPVPVLHITRKAWARILRAGGRDPQAAARKLREAADAGKGRPAPLGAVVAGRVKLSRIRANVHNVAAVLPGAGPLAEQYVVVGAHYDHVGFGYFGSRARAAGKLHPGADDNASGAAGVMTLGRWFSRRADAPANRRSLLFVTFAGEELGLLGSRHLVANVSELGIRREQIAAMVNMDMIGRLREGKLTLWGLDSGDRWRRIVREASEGTDLKLRLVGSGLGASDHVSFYRAKIPVLCLNTGMHADLHSPTDTADKINPAGALAVLRLAEKVIEKLWSDEQRIAYAPPKGGAGRRGGAYLGITADSDYAGGGCRIGSATEDGPAAKAGLKRGDVITRWNGKPVANAAALLTRIRAAKPRSEARLTVRRDGKAKVLTVKLGGR